MIEINSNREKKTQSANEHVGKMVEICNAHLGVSVKTGTSDNIGTHRTPFSTMSEIRSYTYCVCVGAPSINTYQASSKLNANYDLAPNDSGCREFYQINVNQY